MDVCGSKSCCRAVCYTVGVLWMFVAAGYAATGVRLTVVCAAGHAVVMVVGGSRSYCHRCVVNWGVCSRSCCRDGCWWQ